MGNLSLVKDTLEAYSGSNYDLNASLPVVKKVQTLHNQNRKGGQQLRVEDMVSESIIDTIFRNPKTRDEILQKYFKDFGYQKNMNPREQWRKNLVKELNELHTAGLSTTDYFTQDLIKTRFEKYFTVVEHGFEGARDGHTNSNSKTEVTDEYYSQQFTKFSAIYSFIAPYLNKDKKEQQDFFGNLALWLEGTKQDKTNMNNSELDATVNPLLSRGYCNITFTLLEELKETSPDLIERVLTKIHSVLQKLLPQILEANNYRFYEREKSLNEYRDYLVKLIEEKDAKQSVRDLALRILVLIANLRESGEDYLTAYNLIVKHQMKIDLRSELIVNSDLAQCAQKPKEEEEKTDESLEQSEVREEFTLEQKPEGFKYCQASEVISIRELKESIDDIDNCNKK